MNTLHFDCFAGISGDMALGALVGLGADPNVLIGELKKLGLGGWNLRFEKGERNGITGTHAIVELDEHSEHNRQHDDAAEREHHSHASRDAHSHRHWKDIRRLIEDSAIGAGAKKRALAIFSRIAEAEAQVHGKAVDDVAFHEVGALDSIVDIVGTAICLDLLKPERITCGAVELGGGTVQCAHGELPVPAPATLLLVRGMPVKTGGFNKEMTTPTGAGILAASVDAFVEAGAFREVKTAYGIGQRKMEKPNLLRVSWREEADAIAGAEAALWQTEKRTVLEANIDDMNGEELGFLMENLFDAGALDVWFTPVTMKKSRPATKVSVLFGAECADAVRKTVFERSTTIGFREFSVDRLSLKREQDEINGTFGKASYKTVFYNDIPVRSKIEYEDRARVAREKGVSLRAAGDLIRGDFGNGGAV